MSGSLRKTRTDFGKGRQTGTQTGQIVDETRSKPHISPGFAVLLDIKAPQFASSSLDATTGQRQEGVGLQSILPDSIVSADWRRLDYCFQKQKPLREKNHVETTEEKMKP